MKFAAKYKVFSDRVADVAPSRLLKFKSSKWLKNKSYITRVTKNYLKKKKRKKWKKKIRSKRTNLKKPKVQFKSKYGIVMSLGKMPRIKNHFKTCLQTKVKLNQFFGFRSTFSALNIKSKNFDLMYKSLFIKQFFKIEILLWKLNFFKSTEEAVQNLVHGKILINGLKKNSNYFLKKGDIITFLMPMSNCSFLNKDVLKSKIFLKKSIFPFVEVDFFTKTVIILKDKDEMSVQDILLFTPFVLNMRHLK